LCINRVEAVKRLAEAEKELAKARNDKHAAAEEVSESKGTRSSSSGWT
jgi:hypothetical protein